MKIWLIIIISLFLTIHSQGQEDTVNFKSSLMMMPITGTGDMAIQDRVNMFFQSIPEDKLLPLINENDVDVSIFRGIIYRSTYNKESLLVNQIQARQKDLGINLAGNTRYNFNKEVPGEVQDDKTKYSVVAGLQWDVLESGWKENQIKGKQLTKEFQIERLEQKIKQDKVQFPYRQRQIVTLFNTLMLDELNYHLKLYEYQITLYLEMYYENLIPYTPIIELKKEKEKIEIEINRLKKYNQNVDRKLDREAHQMPIFDIDLDELLKNYQSNSLTDSVAILKKELLNYVYQTKNMPSVGVMAQYRVFQPAAGGEIKHSPVVNMTFKVPINRGKAYDARSKMYEAKIIEEEVALEKDSDSRLIVDFYMNYQSHLEELKGMYYELYYEREHFNASKIIKNRIEKKHVNSTFSRLNKILKLRKGIIRTQQKMYLIALQIFTVTGTQHLAKPNQFVKPIKWNMVRPNQAIMTLDVTKDLSDIQFYMTYLQRKNYKKIYLTGKGDKAYMLTLNMLQMEGFQVFTEMDPTILRAEVSDFQSVQMIKRFITNSERKIVLSDVHELIELEMNSL